MASEDTTKRAMSPRAVVHVPAGDGLCHLVPADDLNHWERACDWTWSYEGQLWLNKGWRDACESLASSALKGLANSTESNADLPLRPRLALLAQAARGATARRLLRDLLRRLPWAVDLPAIRDLLIGSLIAGEKGLLEEVRHAGARRGRQAEMNAACSLEQERIRLIASAREAPPLSDHRVAARLWGVDFRDSKEWRALRRLRKRQRSVEAIPHTISLECNRHAVDVLHTETAAAEDWEYPVLRVPIKRWRELNTRMMAARLRDSV